MAKKARPAKRVTKATVDEVCRLLRIGAHIETAAAHAGLDKSTYVKWIRKGRNEVERRALIDEQREEEAAKDDASSRKVRKDELRRREKRDAESDAIAKATQNYVDFYLAVDKAIAEGELRNLAIIAKAAEGGQELSSTTHTDKDGATRTSKKLARSDWKAAAWVLERRHPSRYGSRHHAEHSGNEDKPVRMTFAEAIDAARRAKERGE